MSEFSDLKTEIGSLKLELLAKGRRIKELEAELLEFKNGSTKLKIVGLELKIKELQSQIAVLRAGLELSTGFMEASCKAFPEHLQPGRIIEKCKQALSSDSSELLEAVREARETIEVNLSTLESILPIIEEIRALQPDWFKTKMMMLTTIDATVKANKAMLSRLRGWV